VVYREYPPYLAEQEALREKYPVTPGTRSSPKAAKGFRDAQAKMSAGLARVLTTDQKKAIQASQEARMAQQRRQSADQRLGRQ
jgi:hypothetical protein